MSLFPQTKKSRLRAKGEKYSPLGGRFSNRLQIEDAARRRAAGAVRTKLNPLREEGVTEGQAHAGRVKDLDQTYDYMDQGVQDAYAKTQSALDKLIATHVSSDQASQAALAAALASSRGANLEQANAVGGVLPTGDEAGIEQSAAATGASSLGSLAAAVGDTAQTSAAGIGRARLGRARAVEDEQQRNAAKQAQILKAKTSVKQEAPALKEEALEELENAELAKQTEKNREKIAKGSLHLEGQKTDEEQRHHEAEEGIAWASIRAEKQKFQKELQVAQQEGANQSEINKIKARGEQYERGVDVFQSYFENTKPKQRNPATLFKNLTLTVSPEMALKIMEHANGPEFAAFVRTKRGGGSGGTKGKPGPYRGAHPGLGS
jgi:hypothetical protein